MAQTVKEKRTLVRFAVQKTRYVAGNGAATEWETIKVNIGTTDDGRPITTTRKAGRAGQRKADNDRLFLRRMAFVLRGGGYTTTVRRRYPPRPRAYAVCQSRLRRLDNKRRPHIH